MKAARAGHFCTVQFLISKGADVNRKTSTNDHTVLSLACAGGHLAVVELLLTHGGDPAHRLKVRHLPIWLKPSGLSFVHTQRNVGRDCHQNYFDGESNFDANGSVIHLTSDPIL